MANKLVLTLALAASLSLPSLGCVSTTTKPKTAQPSALSKMGDSVKSGTSKVVAAVTPKKSPSVDVPKASDKPGANVFVAMAQLHERNGNFDEAEAQYKKALDVAPNHLNALVGYAHLEDRRNHLEAATKLYARAVKKHPQEASAHNDLGLCYHRRNMLPEAAKSLSRAVELRGENKLYHDNLAAVLVDQGKTKDALEQLISAHGEAVGNYNLGYLLSQKHNDKLALVHFRKAAEIDPTLGAARQWIAKLSSSSADGQLVNQSSGPAVVEAGQQVYPQMASRNSGGLMLSSGVGSGTQAETRGVQFPQARRPSDASYDAVPPTPGQYSDPQRNVNRLPAVSR